MKIDLKWLLLIPVFAIAVLSGFLFMQLTDDGGSEDSVTATTSNESEDIEALLEPYQERVTAYQSLLTRNPNDLEAIKGMADSYLEMGVFQSEGGKVNDSFKSYKSAVDQYRKYLSIQPGNVEVRKDLGLVYSYLQMTDIALRELRTATTMEPNNQRAWHSLGYVLYFNAGDLAEARDAWQKSYNIDPNSSIGQESKTFMDQYSSTQIAAPATP